MRIGSTSCQTVLRCQAPGGCLAPLTALGARHRGTPTCSLPPTSGARHQSAQPPGTKRHQDVCVTPAVRELEAAGVAFTVHEYERGESLRDFGVEAAEKLALDPDQVFKTLLVTADGGQAVAIVPVSGKLSLKSVGKALGAKRVDMCDPAVAERV